MDSRSSPLKPIPPEPPRMPPAAWHALTPAGRAAWLVAWDAHGRAAGHHSDRHDQVCTVCRRWVADIVFVNSTGGGGIGGSARFCAACAPVAGRMAILDPPAGRDAGPPPERWSLADRLILWAIVRLPDAARAIGTRGLRDRDYADRCLAAMYRARAAAEADWVDRSLANHATEVRRLAPLIREANGFAFTAEHIDARCALIGVTPDAGAAARQWRDAA